MNFRPACSTAPHWHAELLRRVFVRLSRERKLPPRSHFLRTSRRRAVRALGCRPSGSTPSGTVGRFRSPLALLWPVRLGPAIPPASDPSSAHGPRVDLHGGIPPTGETLHGPK